VPVADPIDGVGSYPDSVALNFPSDQSALGNLDQHRVTAER